MGENQPNSDSWFWTAAHRRAISLLLILLCIYLAARLILNRTFLNDPVPESGPRANDLANRLDPNSCTWQELAAIPTIGEVKAHAIVNYREKWCAAHHGAPAYTGSQDLRNIKGFGPATVANIAPYLTFAPSEKEK